ncbi:MAG TPA: glutathione S-transferase family protein [bacterium]|jgi:glutathione S-transferase
MKLYLGPLSLFSRKVDIALREKGLACEREFVAFSQAQGYAPKHPAVLAANPKGQVPVLVDGALTLYDSTVILEYLEDAYPAPPLYPRDAAARARCRLLELYADEVLFQPVRPLLHRSEPPHPDAETRHRREHEALQAESALLERYGTLQQQLGGAAWFCGDFSVADIALFMTVLWAQRLLAPRLAGHPALAGWYERMAARPSVAAVAAEIAAADRQLSPDLGA